MEQSSLSALFLCATLLAATTLAAQVRPDEPVCGGVKDNPKLDIEVCTRAIEFGSLDRSDLAKAYYTRGTEWTVLGNHDRAISDFNLALELDPKFAAAHYNRALSWSAKGDSERAIGDFAAAAKLNPRHPGAFIGLAVEYTARGDYKRAIAEYERAIQVEPDASSGYFGRGRARFYASDFSGAASDFYRAHQIEPSVYTALWLYLARKRADIPGEKTLAQDAGTSGSGPWPASIVALYLGAAGPEAVMRAASDLDAQRHRERTCEASFYVAQWHLIRRAVEPALKLLHEAESTCGQSFIEREGAIAELRRLKQRS